MPSSQSSSNESPTNKPSIRSGSISSTTNSPSTRAQRRGTRTTNACEACKKRKTKCTGPSDLCEACRKADTFCHFNMRLDTRRKQAYKPDAVRSRQQYILDAVLRVLKHSDATNLQELLLLIRGDARPLEIAGCLRRNIQSLQQRDMMTALDVDETDLMSLGLQTLFSHRASKSVPKLQHDYITTDMITNKMSSANTRNAQSHSQSISPVYDERSLAKPMPWLDTFPQHDQFYLDAQFKQPSLESYIDPFMSISTQSGCMSGHFYHQSFDFGGQIPVTDFSRLTTDP